MFVTKGFTTGGLVAVIGMRMICHQHRETRGNRRHPTFRCWTSWHKSKRTSSTIYWALKDYEKSEEINQVSEESKNLITEMSNNKIFEFYETSLKKQCPDCALCWEVGIVYCTCGNACSLRKEINRSTKNRYGSLSILGYAIKKPIPRPEAWSIKASGFVSQSTWYSEKSQTPKNGSCTTILSDVKKIKSHWLRKGIQKKELYYWAHLPLNTIPIKPHL